MKIGVTPLVGCALSVQIELVLEGTLMFIPDMYLAVRQCMWEYWAEKGHIDEAQSINHLPLKSIPWIVSIPSTFS